MFRPLLAAALFVIVHVAELAAADEFSTSIRPLLSDYCNTCHSSKKQKGDLDLEQFNTVAEVKRQPAIWQHVLDQLRDDEMPPKDKPQLSPAQEQKLSTWINGMLKEVALANAGDPGPVILRRLSNAEYTYTIRDITGVEALDPAREFPADGAAGEGFTNASAALVMSPALLAKYLDAAKEIANHAVLLPEGIRFSPHTSARDWTDETLGEIRGFYAKFSHQGGYSSVNLQGVKFDTNTGGRLAAEKYITALQLERENLKAQTKSISQVAQTRGLNAGYLGKVWDMLNDKGATLLLRDIRSAFWANDMRSPSVMIDDWQRSLWRFASVGHIGKANGPKAWQEPVTPLVARHEIAFKLEPPADGSGITVYLCTSEAGDGAANDLALWENPRLVAPGRPDLPLLEMEDVVRRLNETHEKIAATAAQCLAAVAEAESKTVHADRAALALKHKVDKKILAGWLNCLGLDAAGEVAFPPLLARKMQSTPDYDFVKGWTGEEALSVIANSSDMGVRVPGVLKPHSVAVHPSPKLAAVIAWRSPVAAALRIRGSIQHSHPECGNSTAWTLEVRRGQTREVLAKGVSQRTSTEFPPLENIRVLPGDALALVVDPKEGNHSCDLTAVDLVIHDGTREWNLARDVSPDILASNPHADSHGNKDIWHFFGQSTAIEPAPAIPGGSLLATWRESTSAEEKQRLALAIQSLLRDGATADETNKLLRNHLLSFSSPLFGPTLGSFTTKSNKQIRVEAPSAMEFHIPASLADGATLVATGRLQEKAGTEGSVQMQVLTEKPEKLAALIPAQAQSAVGKGTWSENNLRTSYSVPIIVNEGSAARPRFETAFDDFRQLFPIALCYTKIVPVDEVVTLTLYHREDEPLQRLMLDESERARLNRLWDDLLFISEAPLKQVDVFEQLYQFATQDANPAAFEPMREPILQAATAFKAKLSQAEPAHLKAVIDLAAQAWRRPTTQAEEEGLRNLYQKLRQQDLPHAAAVRMLLARVLVSPGLLYRGEQPAPSVQAVPVTDWELASRLSYFFWSSAPDVELRSLAAAGRLHDPDVLATQARRMLKDSKIRRLAAEFGCQWLQIRDLSTLDEKSERHFPTFASVRGAMEEEAVRFFIGLFQQNGSVLSLLNADHTFVDGDLARHYGFDIQGPGWQRVDGLHAKGRGGILAFAATLAKQSGASRTSPILRGNWVSEVLLGEKLPKPPKDVPILPDEAPKGLTERQLIERHSSDAACARCHQRIDPFGFALEGFDAIGRARRTNSSGLTVDAKVHLPDGTALEGLDGLRTYLATTRRDDFLRQFCRKLTGYALGRSVLLSDQPLIDAMVTELHRSDHRIGPAIDLLVRSRQFREVRGRDFVTNN